MDEFIERPLRCNIIEDEIITLKCSETIFYLQRIVYKNARTLHSDIRLSPSVRWK